MKLKLWLESLPRGADPVLAFNDLSDGKPQTCIMVNEGEYWLSADGENLVLHQYRQ